MKGASIWSFYDGKKDVIMRQTMLAFGFVFLTGLSSCGETPPEPINAPDKTPELTVEQTTKQKARKAKKAEGFEQGQSSLADVKIARIGATFIYQSDVERLAAERDIIKEGESLPPLDEKFQSLLDELIDQRLLAMEAVQRAIDQSSENKRRLAAARERILSNMLIEEHLREQVTDETILRLYNEQAALANRGNELRARHIVVKSQAEALEVADQLKQGGDFATLAFEKSVDAATKEKGGDLGWITRDRLAPDLTQVLFSTGTGERTEVFQTNEGWHVAEVIERRAPKGQEFETVRPRVRSFLTYNAIQSLLTDLRKENEVETFFSAAQGLPGDVVEGLPDDNSTPSDDMTNTEDETP